MLIEHSKLVGLPVFDLETQTHQANLVDFFIDEENADVEAAIVKSIGFFHRTKFISGKEILELSKNALIVQKADSVVEPKEMIRLNKKQKKRAKIIGEQVVTKKGVVLGKVHDYVLDDKSLSIIRIYVKRLFDERVIHSSAIIKIEQRRIIVKDNFEMVKPEVILPSNAKLAN